MVPRIIYEAWEEKDMMVNLRVDFKDRQHKHLSKSITIARLPTKKSCA